MKRIFKIMIVAMLLFAANVYAADPQIINVEIQNGVITVTDFEEQTEITDYSKFLTYSNNTLTIKKGTIINAIFTNTSLTITSNDEYVQIRTIQGEPYFEKFPDLTIKELKAKHIGDDNRGLAISDFKNTTISDTVIENFYQLSTELDGSKIHIGRSKLIADSSRSSIRIDDHIDGIDLRIVDSEIKIGRLGIYSADGLHQFEHDPKEANMHIITSEVTILDELNVDSSMTVMFSSINGTGEFVVSDKLEVEQSFIKFTNEDNTYPTLMVGNEINVNNSKIFLENKGTSVPFASVTGKITFNDNVNIVDYTNTDLTIKKQDDYPYNFYVKADGTAAKNISISNDIKITFRIKNGTWADGSTKDITIIKRAMDRFEESDIPTGMVPVKGAINGTWNREPKVGDSVSEEYVYVYSYTLAKADSNPTTGVFNYTLIIVGVCAASLILYNRIKKKSHFNK